MTLSIKTSGRKNLLLFYLLVASIVWSIASLCCVMVLSSTSSLSIRRMTGLEPVEIPTMNSEKMTMTTATTTTKATKSDSSTPHYEGISGRLDKWTTGDSSPESAVLTVVSHQQMLIGCHSFQEYLSPKYHTLIVLPKDYALALFLDEMIENASPDQTAGVHLFFVEGDIAGELMGRRVGEEFVTKELEPRGHRVEFLNFISCDVHQLPQNHAMFVSTEDTILKLEREFRLAKQYRQRGQHLVTNYNPDGNAVFQEYGTEENNARMPQSQKQILAMNTNLFEQVPNLETVSKFHGVDIFRWWKEGGWKKKPQKLIDANLPWLYDVSIFVETHQLMFDLEALRSIKSKYFGVSNVHPNEVWWIGYLANRNNLTVVRNNDVLFHLDFQNHHGGKKKKKKEELAITKTISPRVDLDWVKVKNLELLGRIYNPKYQFVKFQSAYEGSGVAMREMFTAFLFLNYRERWLPKCFRDGSSQVGNHNDALKVLESILKYFGYHRSKSSEMSDGHLRYELEGIYPGNLLVKSSDDEEGIKGTSCVRFLKGTTAMTTTDDDIRRFNLYICKFPFNEKNSFSFEQHVLKVPINATIKEISFYYKMAGKVYPQNIVGKFWDVYHNLDVK